MQFRTTGLLLLGAMVLPTSGIAQTTPAPPAITRTVVAATKLPTVTDVPLHFKAVRTTLQPNEKLGISAANGILYQMSGSTEVSLGGEAKMLNDGEGLFIAGGRTAALTAGSGGPSTFLHFILAPAVDLGRPAETAPAVVRELYRTANPIPDLKPGGYDLNLTRVTFPAQMPSNPPHHRFKQCRRVATRYDKLAANYLAFVKLASIRVWLRANESAPCCGKMWSSSQFSAD